ncbi:hypothetical protein ONE63_007279 [Megalurothrips usitatus]|uniref:Transposable element P transposase n=1 Tax=Megalurothrips usitatus TaxID=439358 RepID=A0AAV7XU55_9NEOP|nr:hypothetical protein ONE63_007279 [Megalurothrips usitatus]
MPRLKGGSGFSHPKRGRTKHDRGHARGGRPHKSTIIVGEIESGIACQFESGTDSETDSYDTNSFMSALSHSESEDGIYNTDNDSDSSYSSGSRPATTNTPSGSQDCSGSSSSDMGCSGSDTLGSHQLWLPIMDDKGVRVTVLSRGDDKALQRNVYMKFDGSVRVTAHRRSVPSDLLQEIMLNSGSEVALSDSTVRHFVDRTLSLVLCAGADYEEYADHWKSDESGYIDNNPYDECRYSKTFRSNECSMLVPDRKIDYLHKRIALLLKSEGQVVDDVISNELLDTLESSKVTSLHALFIQQQQKAASLQNAKGMRWHPTMIRLALLKSQASGALDTLRCAGLSFPSDRTLYDYSHVEPTGEGIMVPKIDRIAEKVSNYEKSYQRFHNLLMDEIHISQKLVYQKSTGNMIGYVRLTEVEEEMMMLSKRVNGDDKIDEPSIAKTIFAYMLKGVCNDVKEVIAAYTANAPTKEFVFDRTWDVITRCEVAERKLYFISDVPHLLKTIRNCFAKSGVHPKAKRLLTKGNEVIVWKTIVRLFLEDCDNTWRQSCKLNSVNVYLNSYSCMKVLYPAQVLSHTVGMDLKSRKWKGTSETVDFILLVNDVFDYLNGAHTQHGKRTANPKLNPYTDPEDQRFEKLMGVLKYFLDWETEVKAKSVSAKIKEKMLLARATLDGIEITINAFIRATQYMLKEEKAYFINARVYNQDPLEQYFGKQRASLGGKSNPNSEESFFTDRRISNHRNYNVRKRSGNTQAENRQMEVSDEPLPKRKRGAIKK